MKDEQPPLALNELLDGAGEDNDLKEGDPCPCCGKPLFWTEITIEELEATEAGDLIMDLSSH